jgi:hypothetical protein
VIIQNGTIEKKGKTGGGIDPETGHPIKPTDVVWGTPIPCQYIPNSHNNLGVSTGQHYTQATYTVLIEEQPFDSEQIRLKDKEGQIIGEFSVLSVEPLDAVCEVRILI